MAHHRIRSAASLGHEAVNGQLCYHSFPRACRSSKKYVVVSVVSDMKYLALDGIEMGESVDGLLGRV